MKKNQKRVFLDYASITPFDPKAAEEARKAEKAFWANPSSLHTEGDRSKEALEDARLRIARVLHCKSNEIFFTSGGTESLNLSIFGTIRAAARDGFLPHVILSTTEHPAVLEPVKSLLKEKEIEASFISPDEKGVVSPESVKKELKDNTVLVIIQHANNEIGTIQPTSKISKAMINFRESRIGSHDSFPYLLVDASQSVLYEDVSLERLGADILVLDGIKAYGPRGVGVLALKRGVWISPVLYGGGQEGGLRSGTQNVPAALGLAKAIEIAAQKREKESQRLAKLRDYAAGKILKEIPGSSLNGGPEDRLPNNINICFPGQDSEFLVIKLDTFGFAVSAASACHALSLENGSYVIEALGKPECASSSLRITLGRDTKKTDLDSLISALKGIIH